MGPLDRIQTVEEADDLSYTKLLLYGPPGVGKTSFASDAPSPIWIDFEKSAETLKYIGKGSIPRIVPKDTADLRRIITAIIKDSQYETIVIDSLSQLQDVQLDKYMEDKHGSDTTNPKRFTPFQQDFRISTEDLKHLLRMLQFADINVVVIAHDRTFTEKKDDGSDRVIAIRPDMTPRVNDAIARLINICAYYEKETAMKGTTRKLYVNSTNIILAKNRLGIQEQFLTNPKWSDLIKGKN